MFFQIGDLIIKSTKINISRTNTSFIYTIEIFYDNIIDFKDLLSYENTNNKIYINKKIFFLDFYIRKIYFDNNLKKYIILGEENL